MSKWYILYVKNNYEHSIAQYINTFESVYAFVPTRIKLYKRLGKYVKVNDILMKNYVFIETELESDTFYSNIIHHLRVNTGYLKVLLYPDKQLETILPEEKAFLKAFMNKDNEIDASSGFIEGDQIIITSGPLVGKESIIKRIDRHKRIAICEVTLMGRIQELKLSLEILSKS
ncbi:MAG: antiterminator LoaP [Erysipelotrichaceae bacterium]